MNNLLNKIFAEHNFTIHDFGSDEPNVSFAERASQRAEFQDYYLLYSISDLNSYIKEEAENKYNSLLSAAIKANPKNPTIEKNTSLLVFCEKDTIDLSESEKKIIFDIEENPYHFKKYVLTYTQNQVAELLKEIENISFMDYSANNLFKSDNFKAFKNEPKLTTSYNLLIRLFIKLPFLNVQIPEAHMINLKERILNSLGELQNLSVRSEALDITQLESFSDEQLLDYFQY